MTSGRTPADRVPKPASAFSRAAAVSTRTPLQSIASASAARSVPPIRVPVGGYPMACWRSSIRFRLPSAKTTTVTGTPSAEAIRISVAVIANPPSPTRAITGRSGRVSLAAIAAGTPNPMADRPLGISTERGSRACHT